MAQQAASYEDAVRSNNALFQNENPFDFRQENIRFDWQMSQAQRMTSAAPSTTQPHRAGRHVHQLAAADGADQPHAPRPEPPGQPLLDAEALHRSTRRSSTTRATGRRSRPSATPGSAETYGFQFPQPTRRRRVTENSIRTWTSAASPRSARDTARCCRRTWDYSFSDIVTWMKGAHTIKGGVLVVYNRRTRTAGPSIRAT